MTKRKLITLLRDVRQQAGLTQATLATRLGQTQSYVSKYEAGEQRLDLLELEAICKAVEVPLPDFVERYLES
jgi:transcriptional regulator with XRE-family HTH domain